MMTRRTFVVSAGTSVLASACSFGRKSASIPVGVDEAASFLLAESVSKVTTGVVSLITYRHVGSTVGRRLTSGTEAALGAHALLVRRNIEALIAEEFEIVPSTPRESRLSKRHSGIAMVDWRALKGEMRSTAREETGLSRRTLFVMRVVFGRDYRLIVEA